MSLQQLIEAAKQQSQQTELQRMIAWVARKYHFSPTAILAEVERTSAEVERLPAHLRKTDEGYRQRLRARGYGEEEIAAQLRNLHDLGPVVDAAQARGWRY